MSGPRQNSNRLLTLWGHWLALGIINWDHQNGLVVTGTECRPDPWRDKRCGGNVLPHNATALIRKPPGAETGRIRTSLALGRRGFNAIRRHGIGDQKPRGSNSTAGALPLFSAYDPLSDKAKLPTPILRNK